MRDFLLRFDLCAYPLAFVVLFTVARRAVAFRPRFAPAMVWTAVAVLLAVTVGGFSEVPPRDGLQGMALLFIAGIAASASALAVFVLLTPFAPLWDQYHREVEERRRAKAEAKLQAEEQAQEEAARQRAYAERERIAARMEAETERRKSLPAPLTREELAVEAKRQFEYTLLLIDTAHLDDTERQAARDQAKRQYLAELDRLLKK